MRKHGFMIVLGALLLSVLLIILAVGRMTIPQTTGPYAVGRTTRHWVDRSRREVLGPADDSRETPVVIWYPAQPGTGSKMPYFPSLEKVAAGLVSSGEMSAPEVFGVRFVRSQDRLDARMAETDGRYPVILFSPGNGTDIEFYDAFAGDLASHGYIVVGINHPYDVAAVALQDGRVAQYLDGPMGFAEREIWTSERIAERTADLLFVLSLLHELDGQGDALLSGRMDLTRVGAMGHSLGGITAAQACQTGDDLAACLNLDGIQRGGPFSADDHPSPPRQPFMMITKEKEVTPAQAALFAAASSGSYRVVLPAAAHDNFTDGGLLRPSLLPSRSETIVSWVRAYTLAFFEQTLFDRESELLHEAPRDADIFLEVYAAQQAQR